MPSILWCVVLGLFVAIEVAELPRRFSVPVAMLLEAAIILSVTFTLAGILGSLAAGAGERQALGIGITGLARTIVRGAVWVVGGLVLLDSLGVQITPLLTALAVGGLAVALALQDTLSNLFAGVHLLADKPIRVGDYVKIDDSIEGWVIDVGWRSTRVRLLQDNVVIVPNKRVAEAVITNFDMPGRPMGFLLEEARGAANEVKGLLAVVDQFPVQHELRKRILRRLRAEHIDIPYPIRTIEITRASDPRRSDRRASPRNLPPHQRQTPA